MSDAHFYRSLGAFIVEGRRGLGLTQADLVRRSGMSQTVVSSIERGVSEHYHIGHFCRVARAIGLEPAKLLRRCAELTAHGSA